MNRTIVVFLLFSSLLSGGGYFSTQDDICKEATDHYCANDSEAIKNLQLSLASDRNLKRVISMDGILGDNTHEAVIVFQKHYGIEPADGWVGKKTRQKLDEVYDLKPFSFSRAGDICEEAEGQECPNEFEEVRNFQIVMNFDKNMSVDLDMDGNWGKNTMAAAVKMQKIYGMIQVDGWIGKGSKRLLDKLSAGLLFPKVPKMFRQVRTGKIATLSGNIGASKRVRAGSYAAFKRSKGYPKSFAVYRNDKLLKKASTIKTKIVINKKTQRIKLFVGSEVAIDSPCTTGAIRKLEPNTRKVYNKSTPSGNFKITEKIVDKRSTIFGKLYRNGKMVWRGDRRKYKGPSAKYIGASLKNWMRLTSSGIGIHGSKYVKRYPATNGCIRVPYNVVTKIFKYAKKGTPVKIVN
ncbi:MAG: L,D-transpeptidase family protein [Sulfurovum sp.]|nr:L,D-transpeptidase family protein [Sulfurovum sp.]